MKSNQQVSSQTTIPQNIYRLAENYRLGTPLRKHADTASGCMWSGCGLACIFLGGLPFIALLQSLLFGNQQFKSMFTSASALAVLACLILVVLGLLIFVYRGLLSLIRSAYECTDGFIEMQGNTVVQTMHWSDVQAAWQRSTRSGTMDYIRDRTGRRHVLRFRGIWERCKQEVEQRGTIQ